MAQWWQDPAVEAHLAVVFVNTVCLLLGTYSWEYCRSFDVEYAVIRGRIPFRWPLIPYLLGRISLLTLLILLAVWKTPSSVPFSCQAGALWTAISAGVAIGASSTNLMIRTWKIWKESRSVHILLSLLALGQWSLIAVDALNMKSSTSSGPCAVHLMHPAVSAGIFVYTTCYDLLVLVLSVVKLSKQTSKSPLKESLLAQGVLYFAVAAAANVFPTVFAFLGADILVGITGNFTVTASTIASCWAVRSLLGLRSPLPNSTFDDSSECDAVFTTHLQDHTMTVDLC